ncbi:MAG: glycosyltransferase family 2 protein [Phycisphaerales bacterium]|nr:glycosyltransferase family 2 protein [Phycisphaerales bacterium]
MLNNLMAVFPNVVAVDDGSSDDTFDAIRATKAHALQHLVNRGQGAALQTATDHALEQGAARIAHFDADGQHRIEDLITMVNAVASGECDIALGNRFAGDTSQIPLSRRLLLRSAVIFHRFASGIALNDVHNGLRVFSRPAARKIEITADRMAHASELIDLIAQSGYRVKEIPVTIRYSEYARNKGQRWTGGFRILFHYLVQRVLG